MTERVVYLAYRNPNAEPEARDMTACSHCRNKTFLIVHDKPEGFPMIQCAACGAHIGRMGWANGE